MIKLTFGNLNDPGMNQALNKLSRETGFVDFKASYNVAKILRRLTKELGLAREVNQNILIDFCEVDEATKKAKFDPNSGQPVFLSDEKREEYFEKHKEFLKTDFEIDCEPIRVADLGTIKLSPHELNCLEPVLHMDVELTSVK